MKPARSPWFQSAALRCSIAAISAWGFPETTCALPISSNSAAPTPPVRHATRMFMASPIRSRDAKRAAGAPRGDGRAIQEALPRTDAEGSLAATLPCRLLPLRLAASLRPGLGPLLSLLLLALGLDGFFRFFAGFGRGADIGSSRIGAGAGGIEGAGGDLRSLLPQPVPPLSAKMVDARIG